MKTASLGRLLGASLCFTAPGLARPTTEDANGLSNKALQLRDVKPLSASLLCPSVDGTTISNHGADNWVVKCNSNFANGAYRSQGVLQNYAQCMDACDANSATGCTAFVYQGGSNGTGSGQCWLMTYPGPYKSAAAGYIAVYKVANGVAVGQAPAPTTTTTTTTSPIPTASLCPAVDGTTVSNHGTDSWVVKCNSDSSTGAYSSQGVLQSYLQCMDACDAKSSTGCTAFVYQGGAGGAGSGQCWLKTSIGTYKSAPNGYVAAYKVVANAPSSTTSSTTTTTTTSTGPTTTSASPTPTPAAPAAGSVQCPGSNGQTYTTTGGSVFTVECGTDHFAGDMGRFNANSFQQCIEGCGSTSGCVDVSLNLGWCYMKNSVGVASSSPAVWGARLIQPASAN